MADFVATSRLVRYIYYENVPTKIDFFSAGKHSAQRNYCNITYEFLVMQTVTKKSPTNMSSQRGKTQ